MRKRNLIRRILVLAGFFCLLQSCIMIKPIPPSNSGNNNNNNNSSAPAHVSSYINGYEKIAVAEMKRTGVPASIKLAQAILESGYGRSELAEKANNHFGIKCGNDWKGKTYSLKGSCYRAYSSAEQGFKEHSDFLKNRSHYSALFKLSPTDYKGWAKGLQKAGYATDPNYPNKLIELIERYNLNRYDKM